MKKQLIIKGKVCEYIKLEKPVEFFCNRCGKRKTARKYAQYQSDSDIKKLCNGCYGYLLSKQNEID